MSLHDVQTAVHVAKDKRNEFGGYNYRTAEGILAATKAALPDGATVVVSDALQDVAGQIFVTATATITLDGGVQYSAQGHALHPLQKKGMDPSQITGAASSYARKYALAGLLALDDGSADPDSRDNTRAMEEQQELKAVEERQAAIDRLSSAPDMATLGRIWAALPKHQKKDTAIEDVKNDFKAAFEAETAKALDGDGIPDFDKAKPDVGDGHEGEGAP